MRDELMDCGLTDKGCGQIDLVDVSSIQEGQKVKFDIIFVSPLERCLKSAERLIAKHKIGYGKVLVWPGLTEVVSKICDFSHSIEHKKQKYEQFDFSLMETEDGSNGHWQDILVDPDLREQIDKSKPCGSRYLQLLENIFPQPLESSERCLDRVQRTLTEMRKICI